jgi:hypothetical protein
MEVEMTLKGACAGILLAITVLAAGQARGQLAWGPTSLVNGPFDIRPYWKVLADPSDPDVIWAATGNFPDPTATSVPPADGFYKSTDGGVTWLQVNDSALPPETNIIDFAIAPSNTDVVYVAANVLGIVKTTDGGASWAAVNSGITHDGRSFPDSTWAALAVAVDPANPSIVYCGVGNLNMVDLEAGTGNHPGFFKSTNGGASWAKKNQGLPSMYDPIDLFDLTSHTVTIASIAVPPQFPSVVVVGLIDAEVNAELFGGKTAVSHGRVFFSTNRAEATWQEASGGLPEITWPSGGGDLARVSLSYVFLQAAEGPSLGIYGSHQAWGASAYTSETIYKSKSKGVYKAQGGAWVRKSTGLPVVSDDFNDSATNTGPVCVSPVNPNILLVGVSASDAGNPASNNSKVYVSLNGAQSWLKTWDSGMSDSPTMGYTEANPLFLAINADQTKAFASVIWTEGFEDDGIYRLPPLAE